MKSLFAIFLVFIFQFANAKNYYFSASGSDANNGTSIATPWKTIAKFNAVFASKNPGDNFLFKRGDVFYGSLVISRSGRLGSPITIGAYGKGVNPVITGFTKVNSWANLGSNIWESTGAVSASQAINIVVINGVNIPMGRTPNTGYYTYQSSTLTTKTSTSLNSSSLNWTGAMIVSRPRNWVTNADTVLAHSGNTITHSNHNNPNHYPGVPGYGFFIQNDVRTLDTANEWYYNSLTKKIRIYNKSIPTNVQVSTVDTLVFMSHRSYITFDGIDFTGSNLITLCLNANPNTIIKNCNIDFSGEDAVWGGLKRESSPSPNLQVLNTTINHTNNNAIYLARDFTNARIQKVTVKNTALQAGMGKSGEYMYLGIRLFASGGIIENCIIDSTGYVPIFFLGNNIIIRKNFITNYDMTKMDGGGIYTWLGNSSPNTGCKIYNNLVLNASGSTALPGTTETSSLVHGIYLDANTANIEVYNNTCANLGYGGLYIYSGASNNNIHDNTFYNNHVNQMLQTNQYTNTNPTTNNTLTKNIFFSKEASQLTAAFKTKYILSEFTSDIGTFTNNYYARPIDDNVTIRVPSRSTNADYTLAQWETASGNDVGSNKSPLAISDVNDLRFEYNATNSPVTVSLPYNYIDVRGTTYNGTISLAPYSSAVLIKNGAIL